MTPEEAKALIAGKLLPKKRAGLTRADFISAWQALADAQKDAIIGAAISGESGDAGVGLERMLNSYARSLADTRADEIVANGTLSLTEFSEVFD